jgi:tRNA pseudouridine32 synthase/23S rRNA pseudouridine746 synthase
MTVDGVPVQANDVYLPNTHLLYFRRLAREPEIPFEEVILFQDERILVADKPHFLPVTPSGLYLHQTLLNRLKKKQAFRGSAPFIGLIYTAGIVIFSKSKERAQYQNLFKSHGQKVYEAVHIFRRLISKLPMTYQSRLESEHFLQMQEVEGRPMLIPSQCGNIKALG